MSFFFGEIVEVRFEPSNATPRWGVARRVGSRRHYTDQSTDWSATNLAGTLRPYLFLDIIIKEIRKIVWIMMTGGWIKDEAGEYLEYHPVNEVRFICKKEELKSLIDYMTYVYNAVSEGGETIKHYRDWSASWRVGEPDIVIAVQALNFEREKGPAADM